MADWVRRDYGGVGVTQYRPGPYLPAVQEPYLGKVLLCIDVSGSMADRDGLTTRLEHAKRGARTFIEEALGAYYKVGLVLWHHDVAAFVPLSTDTGALDRALRRARADGGTDVTPTLLLGIRELGHLTGDRVIAVFGDGDIGPHGPAEQAAREAARHGIRILVRGLGRHAARQLGRIATEPGDNPVIESGDGIASGIASMARSITIRRG